MPDSRLNAYNRRWYDNIQNMTLAVHISQDLPPEVQALIARSLNEAIDDQRRVRRADKYAVSVGHNRVLGLYQSSYSRRWYDPNPITRRAFTFMATIPDIFLEELANRILNVGNYVDKEQTALPLFYDRHRLTGQVQGILRDGQVAIRQSEDGIRLAGDLVSDSPARRNTQQLPVRIRDRA